MGKFIAHIVIETPDGRKEAISVTREGTFELRRLVDPRQATPGFYPDNEIRIHVTYDDDAINGAQMRVGAMDKDTGNT